MTSSALDGSRSRSREARLLACCTASMQTSSASGTPRRVAARVSCRATRFESAATSVATHESSARRVCADSRKLGRPQHHQPLASSVAEDHRRRGRVTSRERRLHAHADDDGGAGVEQRARGMRDALGARPHERRDAAVLEARRVDDHLARRAQRRGVHDAVVLTVVLHGQPAERCVELARRDHRRARELLEWRVLGKVAVGLDVVRDHLVEDLRTGAWVDGEAEIPSRALNIVIRVWGRDEHHDRNIGDPSAATLVQLLHLNERHFQVVEPMPAAATATEPTDGFEVMPAAPPMPSSGGVNSLATAAVADPRKAAAAAAGERGGMPRLSFR